MMSWHFETTWSMLKQSTLIFLLILVSFTTKVQACWDDKGTKTTGEATVIGISPGESTNDCTTACTNEPFCLGVTYESYIKVCYMFNSTQEKTISICPTCRFQASTCKGETFFADPRLPSAEIGCYFTSYGGQRTAEETETEIATMPNSDGCREHCDITVGCVAVMYTFIGKKCYLFDALTVKVSSLCLSCVLLERICLVESSSPLALPSTSSALSLTSDIDTSFSSTISTVTNFESTVLSSYNGGFSTSDTSDRTFISYSSIDVATEPYSLLTTTVTISSVNDVVFSSSVSSSEHIHSSVSQIYTSLSSTHGSSSGIPIITSSYIKDTSSSISTFQLSSQLPQEVTSQTSTYRTSVTTDLSPTTSSVEMTTPSQNFVTTSFNTLTSSSSEQNCYCSNCSVVIEHDRTLEEQLLHIRNTLLLNKTNLSLSKRKKYSAPDERQSSKIIGSIGGIVLALLLLIITVPDISKACSYVVAAFRR